MRTLTLFSMVLLCSCTPSREGAVDGATRTYCERALSCGWYEEDEGEDCYDDMEDVFDDLWPEDECEGDIKDEGYGQCLEEIEEIGCDDWLDWFDALDACSTSDVCE